MYYFAIIMKNGKPKRLIFIYNANSGLRNGVMDIAHKLISPATYECSLCGLTHGVFKEHKLWKSFREGSATEMEFLHKDEFEKLYASKFGHKFTFPVILSEEKDELQLLVSTEELNGLGELEELIALLQNRLSKMESQS